MSTQTTERPTTTSPQAYDPELSGMLLVLTLAVLTVLIALFM